MENMKSILIPIFLVCSLINKVDGQRSFINLTTDNVFSDTVFIGITNKLLLSPVFRDVSKLSSSDGYLRRVGDTLYFIPHTNREATIFYHGKGFERVIQLTTSAVPTPVPVLTVSYLPVKGAAKGQKIHTLKLNCQGANRLIKDYEITAYELVIGEEQRPMTGNIIPAGLIAKSSFGDQSQICISNIVVSAAGQQRFVIKQKQVFRLD
jgi:hypothetical protein